MSLIDQVIIDCGKITSGQFSRSVDFIAITGETATINALANKIGRRVSSDTGLVVNSKNATVVFSEQILSAAFPLFPVRNNAGEVQMMGYRVNVKDSTGSVKNYMVQENVPDETTGLITLLLGDYAAD